MEKLVLVHLSDIHFTKSSGSVHDVDENVRHELLRDIADLTKTLGSVTGVLVTGDIAFSGKRDEYERAAEWLRKVCNAAGCEEQHVSVVPGNHDVDRRLADGVITKMLHQCLRDLDGSAIDSKLSEFLTDAQSANALLAPLAEYNVFAQPYGCDVSAQKPYWQRDLRLSCGTTIRLRGLCSAYVSNAEDDRAKLVLGAAYASVKREDSVLNVTLCHHPPDWFRDQDPVEDHLKSKVHIQLFGHKHAQRLDLINDKVRLVAGAMHPERRESAWLPVYNILEIERHDDENISLRLYQRRWLQSETRFIAERDPCNGEMCREFRWPGFPRRVRAPANPKLIIPGLALTAQAPVPAPLLPHAVVTDERSPSVGEHLQRLTFRFLRLPTLDRYMIALKLELMRQGDDTLPSSSLFLEVFRRAVDAGRLAELWDETEQRYNDHVRVNPFRGS